jgi:hypothetical protein
MTDDVYALKQPHPDGSEWIQEFDTLEEALRYQAHSGGVLVRRGRLPGQPGLWWRELTDDFLVTELGLCGHTEAEHRQHGCPDINMPPLDEDRTAAMLGIVPMTDDNNPPPGFRWTPQENTEGDAP